MAKVTRPTSPPVPVDPKVAECRKRLDELKRDGAETEDIVLAVRDLHAAIAAAPPMPMVARAVAVTNAEAPASDVKE